MNSSLKVILIVPFLIVSIILYFFVNLAELENYSASFVSIALTIATFSITFSLLQYQFSPYKILLRSVSIRQVVFSYSTILISLLPLFTLFISKSFVPVVSLFSIPILAYSVIFLWITAKEESNPEVLLDRKLHHFNLGKFLTEFNERFTASIQEQKQFEFAKPDESPMHGLTDSEYNLIITPDDPFQFLISIVDVSLNNSDLEVYEIALDKFLNLIDNSLSNEKSKNPPFLFGLENLIKSSFERLAYSTLNLTANQVIHNIFLVKVSTYLKSKALAHLQTQEPFLGMILTLTNFCKEISKNNNFNGLIITISLFRELAQKGIYDKPKDDKNYRMFAHYLSIFPQKIKEIGQESVKLKDSNFLYRCLEDLGYLGCSAIKDNQYNVGIECLQSLVQLGREARASKMHCFWTRCSLEPIDHADDKIWWMLSWVWRLEKEKRGRWIDSFEAAYSRLRGFETNIELEIENDEPIFNIKTSKEPHIESFFEERYVGKIDYSDFDNLKESKLR